MQLGNVRRSIRSYTRDIDHQLAFKGPNMKYKMSKVESYIRYLSLCIPIKHIQVFCDTRFLTLLYI